MKHYEIINRLKRLRHQVNWLVFTQILISKLINKILNPYLIPSYSQFGEDRVIETFFAGIDSGTYIDVGCNHPIIYSNTWKLYVKGWKGIVIDPNQNLIQKYNKIRPNDMAIQKVISNKTGYVDFYHSRDSHLISGVGAKKHGHWKRTQDNCEIIRCKSVTLNTILSDHKIDCDFQLLTIDVEGHEMEVLESINLSIYSPQLIVIEMHDFDFQKPKHDPVYSYLLSNGYQMASYIKPTGFFTQTQTNE